MRGCLREQGDADSTMQRNNRPFHHDEVSKPEEMTEVFEATVPMARVLVEHGHVESQFSMAEAHLRGWGAPPDLSQSAEWGSSLKGVGRADFWGGLEGIGRGTRLS